jgi:hypothetical protein
MVLSLSCDPTLLALPSPEASSFLKPGALFTESISVYVMFEWAGGVGIGISADAGADDQKGRNLRYPL